MHLIFVMAYVSVLTSCHTCKSSSFGIQCKDTLFKPLQICQTQTVPDIEEDTIHVNSMVDQKIFGLSRAASAETTPLSGPVVVWAVQP